MSTAGIQMHISSLLMQDRPRSFCIISDNALSLNDATAMSTRALPRRAKSASRHSLPSRISRPYSTTRRVRKAQDDDLPPPPVATGLSRWSSVPDRSNIRKNALLNKPPMRRGLSNDSKEQLQTLANNNSSSKKKQHVDENVHAPQHVMVVNNHHNSHNHNSMNAPPTMPVRKPVMDDESMCSSTGSSFSSSCSSKSLPTYGRSDMSLAHCIAHSKLDAAKKTNKRHVRSIRRPKKQQLDCQQRRNIVDILDAALGSLDLEDDDAMMVM